MARTIPASTSGTEVATSIDGYSGLHIREDGFALLRERLRAANRDNPDFEAQADDLLAWMRSALEELRRGFGDRIVQVLADGAWAHEGIDLRTAGESEDIVLRIVTRLDRREVPFESAVAMAVSRYLRNGRYYIQLDFDPLPLWERAVAYGRTYDLPDDRLGLPLMTEA